MKILLGKIFLRIQKYLWDCVYASFRRKYEISDSFRFNGTGINFYGDGEILIGNNTYIGRYSSIQSTKGCTVKIGNNCSISHYVMIYTENNIADQDFSNKHIEKRKGNVCIGDNCWIGAGVFIREGVNIGNNCVIGANSVVACDVPDSSIFAGVPARLIKSKRNK